MPTPRAPVWLGSNRPVNRNPNVRPGRGRHTERRTMRTLRVSFVLLLLALAASVGAQSLADVSRREGARRKQIKNPSRVITNKDLRPSEAPPPPPPPPPPAAQASAPAAPEGATPAGSEVSDEEKRQKD